MRSGADALVIEGSEAGGHIGPVSLSVLAQEILPEITRGAGLRRRRASAAARRSLAYLEMGAAGAQLGTRFAARRESIAHPRFKQAFFAANARDALPCVQLDPRFPVIPVRGLVNAGTRRFMAHQADTLAPLSGGRSNRARKRSFRSSISGPARCAAR